MRLNNRNLSGQDTEKPGTVARSTENAAPSKEKMPCRIRLKLWYSVDLCEDARPSAPIMSYGSRATQAKPEALVILLRATT
jgi:hypothetical protein